MGENERRLSLWNSRFLFGYGKAYTKRKENEREVNVASPCPSRLAGQSPGRVTDRLAGLNRLELSVKRSVSTRIRSKTQKGNALQQTNDDEFEDTLEVCPWRGSQNEVSNTRSLVNMVLMRPTTCADSDCSLYLYGIVSGECLCRRSRHTLEAR